MPPQKRARPKSSISTASKKPRPTVKPLEKLPPIPTVALVPTAPVSLDARAAPLAREILRDTWGFADFQLEQEAAITRLICGGGAVVVFPTGGGKSLVYQVPALAFDRFDEMCGREPSGGVTLVVSPLIALMKDQTEALQRRGVKAASIDSSQERESVLETYRMLRSGELKLLYCAPERLNNEAFVETIKSIKIRMVAVDEAHCISEWGHAFRPDYLKIARFVKEVNAERVLCLTATATRKVSDDILEGFGVPKEGLFRTTTFRPNLRLLALPVDTETDKRAMLKEFCTSNPGATIVYVTTHQQAIDTAAVLQDAGFNAAAYHAGMASDARSKIQERFMESSDMIIAATIAFGMGIDKADIRNIVHYTIPKSLEGYSQEIGRAGRDSLPSTCLLYLSREDIRQHETFSRADVPSLRSVSGCLDTFFGEWNHADTDHVVEANMSMLGREWDIRPTTMTLLFAQLELRFGLLRAITPKYNSYSFTPSALFDSLPKTGPIESALVSASRTSKGRTHVDVDGAAYLCDCPREQVVHTLQSWDESGAIDLKHASIANRFRVLKPFPRSTSEIAHFAQQMHEQMEARELEGIARVKAVVSLVTGASCLPSALAAYFGDSLEGGGGQDGCGNCGFCMSGKAVEFTWEDSDGEEQVDGELVTSVIDTVKEKGGALDDPRFLARVAWGISSPRATKLGLSKTPVWGCCEGVAFEKLVSAFQVFCLP